MADTILHEIVRSFRKITENTRAAYLIDIDRWVAFAGSDPAGWTPRTAQAYYNQLVTSMTARSAKRRMAPVVSASSWWAKREYNPALNFAIIQTEPVDTEPKRHALSAEQAQLLLETCSSDSPIDLRDRAMFIVGLETGMRRISLIGMNLEAIKESRDGYPVAFVPIKGSRDKLYPVPLSDAAVIALEPWRRWLRGQRITKGPVFRGLRRRVARSGKLVYEVTDDGLSSAAVYAIVTRRAATAGIHAHPHLFRNTFITSRIEAGFSPVQIASITGHKIANIKGLGGMGGYIDASRIGDVARASTPTWLTNLLRKP